MRIDNFEYESNSYIEDRQEPYKKNSDVQFIVDLIKRIGITDFSEEVVKTTLNSAKKITLPKNTFLQEANTPNEKMYLLKKGILRRYRIDEEGKEHIDYIEKGPCFTTSSITSIYLKVPCIFGLQALTEIELYEWTIQEFLALRKRSDVALLMQYLLVDYVYRKEQRDTLLLMSAAERYQQYLKTHGELFNMIPHYHIASYLRMSPETLSRMRSTIL